MRIRVFLAIGGIFHVQLLSNNNVANNSFRLTMQRLRATHEEGILTGYTYYTPSDRSKFGRCLPYLSSSSSPVFAEASSATAPCILCWFCCISW